MGGGIPNPRVSGIRLRLGDHCFLCLSGAESTGSEIQGLLLGEARSPQILQVQHQLEGRSPGTQSDVYHPDQW